MSGAHLRIIGCNTPIQKVTGCNHMTVSCTLYPTIYKLMRLMSVIDISARRPDAVCEHDAWCFVYAATDRLLKAFLLPLWWKYCPVKSGQSNQGRDRQPLREMHPI